MITQKIYLRTSLDSCVLNNPLTTRFNIDVALDGNWMMSFDFRVT